MTPELKEQGLVERLRSWDNALFGQQGRVALDGPNQVRLWKDVAEAANEIEWLRNLRTPDLTEVLARLKALEERLRTFERIRVHGELNPRLNGDLLADEIAAIRKAMGASE